MRDKDRKIDHLENQVKLQKDENISLKNEIKECKKKIEESNNNRLISNDNDDINFPSFLRRGIMIVKINFRKLFLFQ